MKVEDYEKQIEDLVAARQLLEQKYIGELLLDNIDEMMADPEIRAIQAKIYALKDAARKEAISAE